MKRSRCQSFADSPSPPETGEPAVASDSVVTVAPQSPHSDAQGPSYASASTEELPTQVVESSDELVVHVSDAEEDDDWHGIDNSTRRTLALALGVSLLFAPVETLAYTHLCKKQRGLDVTKEQLLEVWDAIPRRSILRDKDDSRARMLVFGVNPRNTRVLSSATNNMPHVHELFRSYISQIAPNFKWSCLCIRQDCTRGPHRDTRNVGNNLVTVLTSHDAGGGLWLYDPKGTVFVTHQGRQLPGVIHDLRTPCVFHARSVLHATQPWREHKRVIMVGFTPIGTLALQDPTVPRLHTQRQSRISDFFSSTNLVD